jgi:UDP:flavonoid glycosyltransferase YjiC (YdhE family)
VRILLLVNGLGLGNATRCHAVIQRLAGAGARVVVMSSGNGLWYFQGRDGIEALHELEALYYGSKDGQLSVWSTLGAVGSLAAILWRNEARIAAVVEAFRPEVAVIDSVYSVWTLRRRGVPIVALNNADVVHESYRRFDDRPTSVRAQFHLVEENDFRFHRWVADQVISPSLDPTLPEVGPPFRRIGPIVRAGYAPRPTAGPARRVLVMLSGSVFGTPVRFSRSFPGLAVDVVGRAAPEDGPIPEGVTYHGKLKDNRELLDAADLAVVNGGFSAVSELFCMRKPMVVVPVPNHAEQWVNARTVQHLGVGLIGTEEGLEEHLREALERLDELRAGYMALPAPADGAAQGAEAILAFASALRAGRG